MNYEQLVDFLQNRMRMSHVYQPVMLMTLLQQGGRCSTTEIARSILAHDQSQVEYYEDVTKNMVGRVLRRHGIVEKKDTSYSLVGYEELGGEQVLELIELCRRKLDEYKAKRGKRAREAYLATSHSVERLHFRDTQVRGPEASQVPLRVMRGFGRRQGAGGGPYSSTQ